MQPLLGELVGHDSTEACSAARRCGDQDGTNELETRSLFAKMMRTSPPEKGRELFGSVAVGNFNTVESGMHTGRLIANAHRCADSFREGPPGKSILTEESFPSAAFDHILAGDRRGPPGITRCL